MQAALAGLTPEQKGAMAQLMPVLASGVDFPIAVAGLPAEARAALAALTPDQQAGFQALLQLRAQAAGPAAAAPPAPADAESARNSPTRAATVGDAPAAPAPAFDPAMIALIQNFLALPLLTETTDPAVLADTVRKLIDLLSSLPPEAAALMAAPAAGAADTGSGMGGTAAAGAGGLKFTPDQIDDAIRAIRITGGEVDYAGIAVILAWLLGFYLASALFTFATGWLMSTVAQRTVSDLRGQVDRKLGKLPLKYFDSRTHGEILSRVTNDVDTISTTLQQSVTQAITSVIQLVGFIAMMLSISWELTLIVLATLPLYVGATMLLAGQSQKFFAAQQKELGAISGHIEEMYSGHAVVKACGREDRALADFDAINERLAKAGWKAQFVSGILFPAMNFISNLGYVLISVVGGVWMTKARLNLGDITAFIQYSRSFTQPIIQTANIANVIQSTVACAERVFEVLDEAEEQADAPGAALPAAVKGEVAIKNLAFSYKPEEPLIKDLSLDVKKGHTIAIVGPTGAGKTTLVNLLMRFYETQGGSIAIDGKDIRDMPRSGLRSLFGMVLQDTWLFNGTIRDNIAYGKDGATEDDVVRAAKAAHADHFIRTLPLGYDTVLNEEATNISSGQKQLLTIARAILADPAILILDEATSSVDTRTEVLIQQAMAALMSDRTAFVIAHRLSTIRDAELILVMDKGSIIEQGNHRELLAKGGFYADLYNAQFTGAPISA
jgi:ATP-binding cassette subfamily B protein